MERLGKFQDVWQAGVTMLRNADLNDGVIKLKYLEAFDGKATKIIIPSEIASLAGLAEGVIGAVKEDKQ